VSPGPRRRNQAVHRSGDELQERKDLPGEHPAGHLPAGGREHRDTGGSRPQGSESWGDGNIEMQVGHDLRDLDPGGTGT